jgi:NADH-quinone oxidoreductase subunit G
VVKPLGETRPGWKVLRVLAHLLGLSGFDFESSQDVLAKARGADAGQPFAAAASLSNATTAAIDTAAVAGDPCSAAIYQLDGLVRRSPALQHTADARGGAGAAGTAATARAEVSA